jgi:hypothetical protein
MRWDMAKVIVERPRWGSRNKKSRKGYAKQWSKTPSENWPKRESIYALKGSTKRLNEHLGPLRRFLRSQVGRPWDQVFSEICVHIRVDSAVQSHVRDHVGDIVSIQVREIDGALYETEGWHAGKPLQRWGWRELYVCPRTGLLREIKHKKRVCAKEPINHVRVSEKCEHRLMDGIWYEVTLQQIDSDNMWRRDVVLRKRVVEISRREAEQTYGAFVFAVSKRQLNKREIRRFKLNSE